MICPLWPDETEQNEIITDLKHQKKMYSGNSL